MTWKTSAVAVGLAAGLAACGGSSKGGNLSVSAKGAADAPAAAGAAALDAGNGIAIDAIRLVVRKLEVEGGDASCAPMMPADMGSSLATGGAIADDRGGGGGGSDDGPGDDSGDDEECEIEAGPFLVELTDTDLLSGTHPAFDATVPAGTYEEISLRIEPISAEKAARAPVEEQRAVLAELAARGVSLEVTGTEDGTPFTFSAALDARLKREGAITIDADSPANVTFMLGAAGWFMAADGSKLDPADPAARSAILANVMASFRLVHDDDHDGADDELDDHGDHGPGHP